MSDERLQLELKMNEADLYLEEVLTDRRVGTIERLSPVDQLGQRESATRGIHQRCSFTPVVVLFAQKRPDTASYLQPAFPPIGGVAA